MSRAVSIALGVLLAAGSALACAKDATISVKDFAKFSAFSQVRISPTGDYLAVAAPDGRQTGLAILDISEYPKLELTAAYKFSPFEHVAEIHWANDERVLFTTVRQAGTLNQPQPTGRLYGMNVDGSNKLLVYGTLTKGWVGRASILMSTLPKEPNWILLATYAHDRPWPYAVKVNIDTGRQDVVATSPLENGGLFADRNGVPRFAISTDDELNVTVAYRESASDDWIKKKVPFDETINVLGFADNGKDIIISTNIAEAKGLYRFNPLTLERTPLLTNDTVEAGTIIRDIISEEVIGAVFHDGVPENRFFDEDNRTAKLYGLLEDAFPGTKITVTSATRDGKKAVIAVESDRLEGDYFLFDTETLKADFLVSSKRWIDPNRMARRKPISFIARDGLALHGYLTLPLDAKADDKLPMIVKIHGGPHGPRDTWLYDSESQLFANRGYAVLQVNFRGSGGYGQDFMSAGYRHWGTAIQDDVMDGVKWAIADGIADPDRICVYGGSFGGYSVLAQLTRYPDAYRCGFAVAGIYDMELMFEEGDIAEFDQGQAVLRRFLGTDPERLRAQSPVHFVDKITAPLYVAHGTEDVRAHVEHYHRLIAALEKHDVPHEKMLIENEGHGFYEMKNRVRFYNAVLAFMDEHIGAN